MSVPRIIEHDGEALTVSEWARRLGVKRQVLHHRLKTGWTVEQAVTLPKGSVYAPSTEEYAQMPPFFRRLVQFKNGEHYGTFARRIGVSHATLLYWRHGGAPRLAKVEQIAEILGCDPGWLAFGPSKYALPQETGNV